MGAALHQHRCHHGARHRRDRSPQRWCHLRRPGVVVRGREPVAHPPSIGRFLPFDAGYRTLGVGSNFDTPEILAVALRRPQYALIFATYAILTLATGAMLLGRRDVN